jgi:hypothetical protein
LAEVLFDHKIPDRDTGTLRQCDVWINAKFGGHWPLSILISCKDHARSLDIGEIGVFCNEVRSTRANTGVIYSRTGFTQPALDKARANGIACCRLYQNEPADIPSVISFEQFACTPEYRVVLKSDLSNTRLATLNDLFDIPEGDKTIIDVISDKTEEAEQVSIQKANKSQLFPPDWVLGLNFKGEFPQEIEIQVLCHWKWYRAILEATLLNGSYCLSDETFRGTIIGPTIDTQGPHPGKDWIEILDRNFSLPANRVTAILYKGDLKSALRESLGTKSLRR